MLRALRILPPFIVLLLAAPARAEDAPHPATTTATKAPIVAEVELLGVGALGGFGGRLVDGDGPFAHADMRLLGAGWLAGAGFRTLVHNRTWRGGWELSLFGVPGVSISHAPLGPDLSLSLHTPWGVSVEGYAGRFFHFGPVAAYADLRLGVAFTRLDVDVHSAILGSVQTLSRSLAAPLVAPRVGALIPLGRGFSFDVSASGTPFGLERAALFAGFAYQVSDDRAQRR